MSKIIRFPVAANKLSTKPPLLSKPVVTHDRIQLGPWEFTCPKCSTTTKFECTNIIFRVLDFYCASCGAFHRVTNPAFTPASKKE